MDNFANTLGGLAIVTSVVIVIGVYTILIERRKLKRELQARESISLTSQYESFPTQGEIEFDEYVAIYTAIAATLGRDATLLRASDNLSEHWSDLDVHDLLLALNLRFGIVSRDQSFDTADDECRVITIGDVVRAVHARRKYSRKD